MNGHPLLFRAKWWPHTGENFVSRGKFSGKSTLLPNCRASGTNGFRAWGMEKGYSVMKFLFEK
jgi:hypothetical protein